MEEEAKRDIERAEEYEQISVRASAIGRNKFELSTGLIIAARYADKLRRVALVAFKKLAPTEIIIRDIAELNKTLYEKLVNEMKIGKLDVIRILVDAEYNEEDKKIYFSNLKIQRFYTEEDINRIVSEKVEELNKKIENLIKENEKLKKNLEEIKNKLSEIISLF